MMSRKVEVPRVVLRPGCVLGVGVGVDAGYVFVAFVLVDLTEAGFLCENSDVDIVNSYQIQFEITPIIYLYGLLIFPHSQPLRQEH